MMIANQNQMSLDLSTDTAQWFAAAAAGDLSTIRALIVKGVDIDARDDMERTAFNLASQNYHTDIMTTILAARQMNYLKKIGLDPFAAPAAVPAIQENTTARA